MLQALSLMRVLQIPKPTQLYLSVVRTIRASDSLERKDALVVVSLFTCLGIVLLNRVKAAMLIEPGLEHQQYVHVTQLN